MVNWNSWLISWAKHMSTASSSKVAQCPVRLYYLIRKFTAAWSGEPVPSSFLSCRNAIYPFQIHSLFQYSWILLISLNLATISCLSLLLLSTYEIKHPLVTQHEQIFLYIGNAYLFLCTLTVYLCHCFFYPYYKYLGRYLFPYSFFSGAEEKPLLFPPTGILESLL